VAGIAAHEVWRLQFEGAGSKGAAGCQVSVGGDLVDNAFTGLPAHDHRSGIFHKPRGVVEDGIQAT
jgi:hypothetical protein